MNNSQTQGQKDFLGSFAKIAIPLLVLAVASIGGYLSALRGDINALERRIIVIESNRFTVRDGEILKEKISILGRFVYGYAWGKEIVVSCQSQTGTLKGLFFHEISHVVLCENGEIYNEEKQHNIFKQVGLGA